MRWCRLRFSSPFVAGGAAAHRSRAAGIPRAHGRRGAVLRASTPWQRHAQPAPPACDRGQSARQTRLRPSRQRLVARQPGALSHQRLEPPLGARAAIVVDDGSGRVIWAANRNRRLPIASTTKIMTAHLVLERLSLNRVITIDNGVTRVPLVKEGLRPGERVAVWKLLDGLLLFSGNDDAYALSIAAGGSRANFVRMMNQEAKRLGLRHTHFRSPSGVIDKDNYSTAADLATITRAAMRDPRFRNDRQAAVGACRVACADLLEDLRQQEPPTRSLPRRERRQDRLDDESRPLPRRVSDARRPHPDRRRAGQHSSLQRRRAAAQPGLPRVELAAEQAQHDERTDRDAGDEDALLASRRTRGGSLRHAALRPQGCSQLGERANPALRRTLEQRCPEREPGAGSPTSSFSIFVSCNAAAYASCTVFPSATSASIRRSIGTTSLALAFRKKFIIRLQQV